MYCPNEETQARVVEQNALKKNQETLDKIPLDHTENDTMYKQTVLHLRNGQVITAMVRIKPRNAPTTSSSNALTEL